MLVPGFHFTTVMLLRTKRRRNAPPFCVQVMIDPVKKAKVQRSHLRFYIFVNLIRWTFQRLQGIIGTVLSDIKGGTVMLAHLNGILAEMTADSIVIDCGGVGYQLTVSGETLSGAPEIGEKMKVYTYMAVREDAVDLFGFATREEKRMFERLRSVSGVGPKSALQILSTLGTQGVSIALAAGDAAAIARAPGIGKKTAQRLILDLRDKVTEEELLPSSGARAGSGRKKGVEAEVIEALMALGCGASEAAEAVARVAGQSEDASELTRLALKGMGR